MTTIESITKNRQSEDVLRAMVERAYGAEEVPVGQDWAVELGNGWFNVAYRIWLRSGTEVVVKIAPPPTVKVLTYERQACTSAWCWQLSLPPAVTQTRSSPRGAARSWPRPWPSSTPVGEGRDNPSVGGGWPEHQDAN